MKNNKVLSFICFCALLLIALSWTSGCGKKKDSAAQPGSATPAVPQPVPAEMAVPPKDPMPPETRVTSPAPAPDPKAPVPETKTFSPLPLDPAGTAALLFQQFEADPGKAPLKLPATFLPLVGNAIKKTLPAKTRLKVLILRGETAFVGALLAVLPPGHVPCSQKEGERAHAYWIARPADLAAADLTPPVELPTQVFEGDDPEALPVGNLPDIPFFVARGSRPCKAPWIEGNHDYTDFNVHELWSFSSSGPALVKRVESFEDAPAGTTRTKSASLMPYKGEEGAYYFMFRLYSRTSTPIHAAPGPGDKDQDQTAVRCERTFTVYKLDEQGKAVVLTRDELDEAVKSVEDLAVVRSDARGSDEAACDKLENQ